MRSAQQDFVRFMRLVRIGEDIGSCWIFTGNCPGGRHGHFSIGQSSVKSHRWMYSFIHGMIDAELVVRHKCDVPNCVNPDHLELGTSRDNTHDMYVRGRNPDRRGTKHPLARISEDQVREIRTLASCGLRRMDIAEKFGISDKYVGKIVRRENWSHIQ